MASPSMLMVIKDAVAGGIRGCGGSTGAYSASLTPSDCTGASLTDGFFVVATDNSGAGAAVAAFGGGGGGGGT
jgi:hypothetical protein